MSVFMTYDRDLGENTKIQMGTSIFILFSLWEPCQIYPNIRENHHILPQNIVFCGLNQVLTRSNLGAVAQNRLILIIYTTMNHMIAAHRVFVCVGGTMPPSGGTMTQIYPKIHENHQILPQNIGSSA